MRQKMSLASSFVRTAYLLITFLLSRGVLMAQPDSLQYLSLEDAVKTVMEQNKSLETANLEQKIAEANFRQTDAIFLPQIGFSYTAMRTNNPMNAFGFKLQQQTITQQDFDPARLNDPSSLNDVATSVDIRQPLLNPDMYFERQGALTQKELYKYKSLRTKEYIGFETEKAYLQLQLAYEADRVAKESLETAQRILSTTTHLNEQGLIKKSDLLLVQVHELGMKSRQAQTGNAILNVSDYLNFLMGQPSGIVYTVDEMSDALLPVNAAKTVPDSRADFMAMQKAIEASDQMIKASQMSYLPKLNAFGSYQFHDKKLAGFGSDSYLAGIQLSWNIFDGNTRRFKLKSRMLETEKLETELASQKEQGQLELNKALRDIDEANFMVRQQKTAVEQAGEALRMLQNRYEQGLATTTDVLTAETLLAQQKMSYAQSIFAVRLNTAYLHFTTSVTQ
ncbi:MAG TPA: TolC family protein [Prolixibacteraceae bacterium]|nr:TolC family protein [Prolixibacteraceae bacterium]